LEKESLGRSGRVAASGRSPGSDEIRGRRAVWGSRYLERKMGENWWFSRETACIYPGGDVRGDER